MTQNQTVQTVFAVSVLIDVQITFSVMLLLYTYVNLCNPPVA